MAQMQADDTPPAAATGEPGQSTATPSPAAAAPAMPVPPRASGSNFGWMLAGLGFSGLVCGCALLVWSQAAARPELWNVGLPIALVSQAVLVVGVLLLLDFSTPAIAAPAVTPAAAPNTSHLHVHSGGLHASGISVHFSNSSQQMQGDPGQLTRQIEAAMRRAA